MSTLRFAALSLLWFASAAPSIAESREQALRNAENAWSEAFVTGNRARLDALLEPEYVSVGATGVAHDKEAVITAAERYAATHPNDHADPMPASSTIEIRGTTGIVRHTGVSDVSVDVFYFDHNRWRALYSQHTTLTPH